MPGRDGLELVCQDTGRQIHLVVLRTGRAATTVQPYDPARHARLLHGQVGALQLTRRDGALVADEIYVRPDHRRQKVASRLVAVAGRLARRERRRLVVAGGRTALGDLLAAAVACDDVDVQPLTGGRLLPPKREPAACRAR